MNAKTNPKELTELVKSKSFIINDKFFINMSVMDSGAFKKTYYIIVKDLVESNFKMKYFNSEEAVVEFLQLLEKL